MKTLISQENIEDKIFLIRSKKVMIDRHLAQLYGVKTKVFNQAVKRNPDRFPEDFIFQLTKEEIENWRSQFVTSTRDKMELRRKPYAFTEQVVAMLSSVLHSKRAIRVNIQIMRAFVKLRRFLYTHRELADKLKELEIKIGKHEVEIQAIFKAIHQLMTPSEKPPKKIGF